MDRTTFLSDIITEARNGYEAKQGQIKALIDAYLLRMNPEQFAWLEERNKSRIYFPKINAKGKRITDGLTETYFNNNKFAKLTDYINSDPAIINKWQNAIDHYTEMLNLYKTFQPIFQKAPFMPLSCVKVYWADGLCQIDEINIDEIFFDPNASTGDDVRYIVNVVKMTKSDMKQMQREGLFKKSINIDQLLIETKPYERYEVEDVYYRENGKWYLSTMYEESTILRDKVELKDGQPFVWGYMLPQIKDINEENFIAVYGEAPLASMLPLQEETNTTRNSFIDGMKQHLAPKLIIPKTAGISRLDIETPSKPIFTSQPQGVGQVPLPQLSAVQSNLEMIEQETSEVTGVSPQQNGISPNRKETATMASIMANEGSVRMQGYIRTFNESFFEPVFERVALLVWKYGDDAFFYGVPRDEIPSFKVSIETGIGALNKEVQRQGLIEANQMIQGQMQMYMAVQDMEGAQKMAKASDKMIREMLPLFGIKDTDEFLGEENDDESRPTMATRGNQDLPTEPQNEGALQPRGVPTPNQMGGGQAGGAGRNNRQ